MLTKTLLQVKHVSETCFPTWKRGLEENLTHTRRCNFFLQHLQEIWGKCIGIRVLITAASTAKTGPKVVVSKELAPCEATITDPVIERPVFRNGLRA